MSGNFKPRKSWMPKDVGFGLDVARDMEIPVPFTSLVYQMFAIAQANGVDGYEATLSPGPKTTIVATPGTGAGKDQTPIRKGVENEITRGHCF